MLETILTDSYFWVTLSFLLFVYVAYRFGKASVLKGLDTKIEDIRKEIDTAEMLRVEAQELLAQYERKQKDAAQEAVTIIMNAKNHAESIMKNAEDEMAATMERREQLLQNKLNLMEEQTRQHIRQYAAELAVEAAERMIRDNLDKKGNSAIVDETIGQIPDRLRA